MKTINSLLLVLCATVALNAQQPKPIVKRRVVRCHNCAPRMAKPAPQSTSTPATPAPTPDFFVGEARVEVSKDETVVRLAMAQHGSVLIELPANDGPRYIIPGDPEMATVDQKALERNKRAIIVRPGSQFLPPARNAKAHSPAATVTAQMRSGLVVTFLFYPVEDLAQNVHRCVLSYNRDEVVARRRAAGLPVNLDTESRGEMAEQSAAPISITVENPPDEKKSNTSSNSAALVPAIETKSESTSKPTPESVVTALQPALSKDIAAIASKEVVAATRNALDEAKKKPKQFKHWTKPSHGLSLAILKPQVLKDYCLAIVAVRNNSTEALKLATDGPDLLLEMIDGQGKSLNIESIKRLYSESSGPPDGMTPGGITYFAVAFVPPALGAHQRVRLSVAQTNAVDEPASIMLSKTER